MLRPIGEIAERMGLDPQALVPYGRHKAKVMLDAAAGGDKRGKLIVVTGMTPTPAGEGKTTTTVGLAQAFGLLGVNAVATLREPSLGPIFGIKGGGTGGGLSRVEPEDDVNIHFTGDAHAVASAHNLLAALTDNAVQRGQVAGMSPDGITLRRVSDMEERSLRQVLTGIGGSNNAPLRETGFDIVSASEVMAVLALSNSLQDLRERLGRIAVGFTNGGQPVTVADIKGAVGSMMSLLRHALLPNLVQTTEGQPVIVHTGPFGNIAHGCSSIVGDRLALRYADYVLTEAGFGADLGFEKFMHIKTRTSQLRPHGAVLVATVRALKFHGGVRATQLDSPDPAAVERGMANLRHLVGVIRSFGLPVVVALNLFPTDTKQELHLARQGSEEAGATAVECAPFTQGGAGCTDLAEALIAATREVPEDGVSEINYAYELADSPEDKVLALARRVYNAADVSWSAGARRELRRFRELGWGDLPICMAKTHLSISDRPERKGRPADYTFEVRDVRAAAGAGFIYPIAGNMVTMPGLPGSPRALDVDADGAILGL